MILAIFIAVFVIPIAESILLTTIGLVASSRWRFARGSEPPRRIITRQVQVKKTRTRRSCSSASTHSTTLTAKSSEPSSSSSIASTSKSVVEERKKPANVTTKNIKKISQTISHSLKPKMDLASFSKKATHKISKALTPKRVGSSTTSSSSAHKKTKRFSPTLNMIREVSNGHCREIVLSEETLGMSRALSTNRAICTGW